jgi:hypothetical protein
MVCVDVCCMPFVWVYVWFLHLTMYHVRLVLHCMQGGAEAMSRDFAELPVHVVEVVVALLSLAGAVNFSLVCKSFRRVVLNASEMFDVLYCNDTNARGAGGVGAFGRFVESLSHSRTSQRRVVIRVYTRGLEWAELSVCLSSITDLFHVSLVHEYYRHV